MDFELNDEQKMLSTTAREFLQANYSKAKIKELEKDGVGYFPELWRQMAKLGWLGLIYPPEYGGTGATYLDLVVLLKEMGRVCLMSPYFSTVILSGLVLLKAGTEQQKLRYLPAVAKGEKIITLALTEPSTEYTSSIQSEAVLSGDKYVISGIKLFVPDSQIADDIIVVTKTNKGITLFIVESKSPGITQTRLLTTVGDKQFEVVFDGVIVPESNILGRPDNGWKTIEEVLQYAALAKCAEALGGAERVLELTCSYVGQRKQFGRPIGSFQAVSNDVADMAIELEIANTLMNEAAWLLSEGKPCTKEVSMAKAYVNRAYKSIVTIADFVQGGVSVITEHEMPLYFRRAMALEPVFGTTNHHLEKVCEEIGI